MLHLNDSFQLAFIIFVLHFCRELDQAGNNQEGEKLKQKAVVQAEIKQTRNPGAGAHLIPILAEAGTRLHLRPNQKRSAGTEMHL